MLRTPFYEYHVKHGAKLVDFAGWQMPILYRSIHEEHHQVRNHLGLFDVSHMGRIALRGLGAGALLERVLTRRVRDMTEGVCRYSLMCHEQGGTIDDLLVYRYDDHWLLVVNAANRVEVLSHLRSQTDQPTIMIEDRTQSTAMLAIQGPEVMGLIGRFSSQVPALKRYRFCVKNLMGMQITISRTGYTGEDGVEVILPAKSAPTVLNLLMKNPLRSGGNSTVQPIGLGARDTLRLEAGMPLYSHELDASIDPISAGLSFAVDLDKGQATEKGDGSEGRAGFIGQQALRRVAREGPSQKLVGLRLEGRRTARQGMAVVLGDEPVGRVTSACLSPTLGYPIAMAYVRTDLSGVGVGEELGVRIGSQAVSCRVTTPPFYRRAPEPAT